VTLDTGASRSNLAPGLSIRKMPVKTIVTLGLLAAAMALTGCNTIAGAGRDLSSVGNTVSKTADRAK